MAVQDSFARQLTDLRISVTDRCNFRCRYCMPIEVFGASYQFLPHAEILTFEEITRLSQVFVSQGVEKLRLTGGEPLLRRDLNQLIRSLAALDGVKDIALTTNGVLLPRFAEALKKAGLHRVTVSLDALDEGIFAQMNGVGAKPQKVIAGIEAALEAGLSVKVNAVIQKGVNEGEVLPLAAKCRDWGVPLRFIEFMDVGNENAWDLNQVFSAKEILETLQGTYELTAAPDQNIQETALRYDYADSKGGIGLIASVTRPFCRGCGRVRLSANGQIFTCLFAEKGTDFKEPIRSGESDSQITERIQNLWSVRADRYSEERGQLTSRTKVEMSYIGG